MFYDELSVCLSGFAQNFYLNCLFEKKWTRSELGSTAASGGKMHFTSVHFVFVFDAPHLISSVLTRLIPTEFLKTEKLCVFFFDLLIIISLNAHRARAMSWM